VVDYDVGQAEAHHLAAAGVLLVLGLQTTVFGVVVQLEEERVPQAGDKSVVGEPGKSHVPPESFVQVRTDHCHCGRFLKATRLEVFKAETVTGCLVKQFQL
jgi:hypothetical protein